MKHPHVLARLERPTCPVKRATAKIRKVCRQKCRAMYPYLAEMLARHSMILYVSAVPNRIQPLRQGLQSWI